MFRMTKSNTEKARTEKEKKKNFRDLKLKAMKNVQLSESERDLIKEKVLKLKEETESLKKRYKSAKNELEEFSIIAKNYNINLRK